MHIIAIATQKGGTGKTTTSWGISGELRKRGYKVLNMDLDNQGSLTMIMGGRTTDTTSYEVMIGKATAMQAIQSTGQGDLIAGSPRLALLPAVVAEDEDMHLRKTLQDLDHKYDFIIIDCPPGAGLPMVSALVSSDSVLFPTESDVMSLRALAQVFRTVESARIRNPRLNILGILPTRWSGRTVLARTVMPQIEAKASEVGTEVLHPIRPCVAVMEAQALVKSLQEYAPGCNASKDYEIVVDRILKKIGV